ncbi:MAG: glycosyltransferase family 4 protein [Proteobacteria bacterium]|nr:glycosyltransferase family 4 protein [Pseudomonadota bacterium]MDA1356569.1 glycosyltransferase family 4 protein [Pseudomonadota bacterium]
MRIAFYAPMKAPNHPSPSGDRRVAQLLWRALEMGGHEVTLASDFRAYDGDGDGAAQRALAKRGAAIAAAMIADWQAADGPPRPDLWFSYHLYHKAPDWLGPAVSAALDIPYVAAEASYARKQSGGPYGAGLEASLRAIARADAILSFTPEDQEALLPVVKNPACLHRIAPFLEAAPYRAARAERLRHREALAVRHGLDVNRPWLLTVAMMRPGDKLASYRLMGRALNLIADPPWQLLVVGDGSARESVEEALRPIGSDNVVFAGKQNAEDLTAYYAAADLLVWPAVNEAFGMIFLEAAAAGLPVVAGNWRGVSEIVATGETGILIDPWNEVDFAEAVVDLTRDNARRMAMAEAAAARAESKHGMTAAVTVLNQALAAAQAIRRGTRQ